MIQYIITFVISCFFTYVAEKEYKKKHKNAAIIFSIIAVFVGAFLAGVRDSSIGSDVMTYGNYVFAAARRSSSPFNLFRYYDNVEIEPLYLLLNFGISRFTRDEHVFYFFLEFIIIGLFLLGTFRSDEEEGDAWVSMWVFYTLFYGFSLNGMRQSVAIALIYFGQQYIYKRQLSKYIFVVILATGFHYTAIFAFLFYILDLYIEKNKRNAIVKDILVVLGITLVTAGFQNIIKIFAKLGPKYNRYLINGNFTFSFNPFIIRFVFLFFFIVFYTRYKNKLKHLDYWIVLLTSDLILSQLRGIIPALYRVSYYFAFNKVESYPQIKIIFNRKSKYFMTIFLLIGLFIIWYYQIVIQGNEMVYPYKSDVLEWIN